MIEDKDIKVKIHEYHKLLEKLKSKNIILKEEFVAGLLIEKLPHLWSDYKQQLKHKHKQLSLADLITYIIIEDLNTKEFTAAKGKEITTNANPLQGEPHKLNKRYENKHDFKPKANNSTFKKKGNCFVCGKLGHHAPQRKRRMGRNGNPAKPNANLVEEDDIIVAIIS